MLAFPELVAHRGHPHHLPENSLSALRSALELGARWVEVDVQLSHDGTPHLYHDRDMQRLSGREGAVHELSDAELAATPLREAARLGEDSPTERIPTLRAAAELCATFEGVTLFVEVKRVAVEAFGVERVLAAVCEAMQASGQPWVLISFSLELLEACRRDPELPIGLILESWAQQFEPEAEALGAEYIFCNVDRWPAEGPIPDRSFVLYEVTDPDRALALHARGAQWIETFQLEEMQQAFRDRGWQA